MRSIIQDGSDDMPPTVFEGAIHIIRGGTDMTKDNQGVFMQFAREVSGCAGNLNSLREALAGVAYCYHISAVEAEIMTPSGNDGSQNTEELTVFIRENASPVGEPDK